MNLASPPTRGPLESTGSEARAWDQFRQQYTDKVFCPTMFPEVRATIAEEIRLPRILDLGCGPTAFLLNDWLQRFPTAEIYASDFAQQMLDAARHATKFSRRIQFARVDHRELRREFGSQFFDTVVSVNSILPEQRGDVDQMISQVREILKPGGLFVAMMPAFETSHMARDHWGMEIQIDDRNHREFDTTGWQCFYTERIIRDLLSRHGLVRLKLLPYRFDSQAARNVIRHVYGQDIPDTALVNYPLFEHFVVARKPAEDP